MLFNLNPGHTLSGGDVGTRGIGGLKEEVLTRQLVGEIDKELRGRGHSTNICRVDYASTLQESLNKQVALCNSVNADLNICIHFNTTVGGYGSEVYTYNGKYLVEADRALKQLNNLGFRNRGIKDQPLALTKRTKAKTIYIEVCFIDSSGDVAILNKYGMNGIAKAIVNGVLGTSS
ncbi:N-acetylmuramoyl-L-alanine amidase, partial [Clostridium botulinum]